jgi:CheY-like chemotaxis protein
MLAFRRSVETAERPVIMPCKNILIVEDDAAIRETLRFVVELEGYKVFTASNGQEGLALLPQMETPCLILLDLMMPVMNGWEFIDALRKDMLLMSIPVVIVSAYGEQAKGLKAKDVIKKPVDLDVLFRTIKKWCSQGDETVK